MDLYEFFAQTETVATLILTCGAILMICMFMHVLKNRADSDVRPKNERKTKRKDTTNTKAASTTTTTATTTTKKKKKSSTWNRAKTDGAFEHNWLLTNLKGHTGQVLDMDFSSDGKYMASCADEDDERESQETDASTTSSDICTNKKIDKHPPSPASTTSTDSSSSSSPRPKGLTRRQRKNRRRDDSPIEQKRIVTIPLPEYERLNVNENDFIGLLQSYRLSEDDLKMCGYPMDTASVSASTFFFDYRRRTYVTKTLNESSDKDSGRASEESSESGDSDEQYVGGDACTELSCARCGNAFYVAGNEYVTMESCTYHWGKKMRVPHYDYRAIVLYSCCKGLPNTPGCLTARVHVWNGPHDAPCDGYVTTRTKRKRNYGVYALDCEMCYTVAGLELTRVTVVRMDGKLVYDSYVRPDNRIVDYNTRFSGITAKDLRNGPTKSLKQVQNDLMGFIGADTILIGHGLNNDLRALRIIHKNVVDTSVCFPHPNGLPYRRSLKSLIAEHLRREIQKSVKGHNSYEDACAAMELMLWRTRTARQC